MYDDTVPEVDDKAGDDDAAIARWAREHRRRMGIRFLSAAAAVVAITYGASRRVHSTGDDAPLGLWIAGLAIAALIALAGVWKLATKPPKKVTHRGWD
jgi:hypothetical protein